MLKLSPITILGFVALFNLAVSPAEALDIGCHTPVEIPALKEQMRKEAQVPVLKFYLEASKRGSKTPLWLESIITMNPKTRLGHRLDKRQDGGICVLSDMTDIRLFDHGKTEPAPAAYIQAPDADALGGINRTLYFSAKKNKLLPMLKANEVIFGLVDAVTYVLGNKNDGSGGVLMSSHNGTLMNDFSKAIPAQSKKDKIEHGAMFTEIGEEIVAQGG